MLGSMVEVRMCHTHSFVLLGMGCDVPSRGGDRVQFGITFIRLQLNCFINDVVIFHYFINLLFFI